jgi:hypothetical protein
MLSFLDTVLLCVDIINGILLACLLVIIIFFIPIFWEDVVFFMQHLMRPSGA